MESSIVSNINYRKLIKLLLGPTLYFLIQTANLGNLSNEGQAVLACTAWIAVWWITEAAEISVTSLLPMIIFPLSGALPIGEVTSSYGNPIIYLYLGGFVMGIAVEKWNLHKRIAFSIINFVGTGKKRVLLGIMIATAFLSMWISNTATAIMMLPIGISISQFYKDQQPFSKNLLLGIGYAASIGGIATLIGTPPNLIFAGIVKESLDYDISFVQWMLFATPLAILLLIITWFYLSRSFSKMKNKSEKFKLEPIGKISKQEKRVALIFMITALLWVSRSFLINPWLPSVDDTMIAIFGALLMFITPAGNEKKETLMNWEVAKKLPWSVLILFGAGLAIAKGFSTTDLTIWIGENFAVLDFMPVLLVSLIIFASINFLTEITSNLATASMLLPVLITLGATLNMDILPLLAGATLSASCAFMLPVATPPNAIVFSSGKITIPEMMRTGLFLNMASIVLVFIFSHWFWNFIFQIDF